VRSHSLWDGSSKVPDSGCIFGSNFYPYLDERSCAIYWYAT